MDACSAIAATEARQACEGAADIETRVRLAMTATKGHYLLRGEVAQLEAACAGAILACRRDDDRRRIFASWLRLVEANMAIAAAQAGDFDVVRRAAAQARDDLLPLRRLWEEA